jgi:hypothetical protein
LLGGLEGATNEPRLCLNNQLTTLLQAPSTQPNTMYLLRQAARPSLRARSYIQFCLRQKCTKVCHRMCALPWMQGLQTVTLGLALQPIWLPPHTGTHAPRTALRSIKLFHEISFKKECLVVPKIFYKKMTKSQQNFGTKRTSTYLKYLTCKILYSFKYLLSLLPLLSLLLSLWYF